jgi:hypothetical protein
MSELPHDFLKQEDLDEREPSRSRDNNGLQVFVVVIGIMALAAILISSVTLYVVFTASKNTVDNSKIEITRINERLGKLAEVLDRKAEGYALGALRDAVADSAKEYEVLRQLDITNAFPKQSDSIRELRARVDDLSVRFKDFKSTPTKHVQAIPRSSSQVVSAKKVLAMPRVSLYSLRGTGNIRGVTLLDGGSVSPLLIEGDAWRGVKIKTIESSSSLVSINGVDHRLTL